MRVNRSWGPRLGAAVVLIGAPVLWASTAWAQPSATVVFTGGCASEFVGPQTVVVPEPRETTIPAGATVRLVNRLGTAGTLSLDGEPAAELPAGAEVEVRLHAGTLAASMEIECADGDTATATATVRTGPAGQAPSTAPSAGSPGGDPDGDQGAEPDETPATGGPSPAATGPGGSAGPGAGSTDAAPAPVPASAGGGTGDRPNSALALVAAACVAGVLAAVIRAFAARRSTRTEWT